jgi:hypothetical protein
MGRRDSTAAKIDPDDELAETVEQIRTIALAGGIREELVPREQLRAMLAGRSPEELRRAPAQYEHGLAVLKEAGIDPNDPHNDDIVFSGSAEEALAWLDADGAAPCASST